MACSPFELMRELAAMQERMNRAWSAVHDRAGHAAASPSPWTPAVDVYETANDGLVVKAEVPGLRREDIDVTVDGQTLTIRGQRRRDDAIPGDAYRRAERTHGPFVRSFALPAAADPSAVHAEYRDGVLTVRVPRRGDARARQIEVAVS